MTREEFIQATVDIARENVHGGGQPFGAIVVKDGKIVGRSQYSDGIIHSEISAISDACRNLKRVDFHLDNCELFSSCKSCKMCQTCAQIAGITKIYYAMDENDAREIGYYDQIFYGKLRSVDEERIINTEISTIVKGYFDKVCQ